MTLFERVKKISKERGFNSLRVLSEDAGLSQNVIYGWKTKEPSAKSLQLVADVLNVSVDYLLGNTDEKNPHPAKDEEVLTETQQAVATLIDPDVDEDTLKKIEEYIKDQMEVSRARAMKYFEETKDQQKD